MRKKWSRVIAEYILIIALVVPLIFFTQTFSLNDGWNVSSDYPQPTAEPSNPGLYLREPGSGETVSIVARVEEKISDHAFSVKTNEMPDEDLLVVGISEFKNTNTGDDLYLLGETVRVTGMVVPFNKQQIEEVLDVNLGEDLYTAYEGKPAVVAVVVEMKSTIS